MAFAGALVTKSVDQTTADYNVAATNNTYGTGGVAVTWDAEIYDTDAFHDTGSNTERLTVGAAFDGKYIVVTAQICATAVIGGVNVWLEIRKNGSANYEGFAAASGTIGLDPAAHINVRTPPILVAAGDYFEAVLFMNDSSATIESDRSSFGIRVVPDSGSLPAFQGVLCQKSADQTAANYSTSTAIAWDGTDVYDTDAAHNPASSNTKIIIPAGWNGKYGVLTASVHATSVTTANHNAIKIVKGGVDGWNGFGGLSYHATGTYTHFYAMCSTQAVLLATSEEYEAKLLSSDNSITVESNSSFGCRIVG